MRLIRRLLLCASFLVPLPAVAQEKATLVADSVSIVNETTLVAEGHVEVLYKGTRLTASRVLYDQPADRLTIEGPIVLDDGAGRLVLADQAALSGDMAEGMLTSARLVLDQQLQLSASTLARVGDRYTALGSTVASSCQICADSPTPLWEVRARRVVHDELERQIYFDHASLRVAGVPVAYIPRLRVPDPTLDRATGFLRPELRTTSDLGTGLKLPYFVALGDSRDVTLTPYVTTKGGRTLEMRYREALSFGTIEAEGAVSRDEILPDEQRGYLFARGTFDLPRDFELAFQIEEVSDRAYYLDYGLGDKDRLASGFEITRARRNEYISGRLLKFRSLREDEDNDTLPSVVADAAFHRRFGFGPLGGEGGLRLETHSHRRDSNDPEDSDRDGDDIADGRDMSRASVRLDWRRNWTLGGGVLGSALAEIGADAYDVSEDAAWEGSDTRTNGAAAVELRWPWVRASASGASDVIQPVLQLVWADAADSEVPNEDSVLVEFDEGNLFALDRFPGADGVEDGRRAAFGVNWTRFDPAGWSLGATLGRVVWQEENPGFSAASGLDETQSDWLAALQLAMQNGLTLTQRTIVDSDFGVTKAEWQIDLERDRYGFSSRYVRVRESLYENRPDPVAEITLDTRYRLTDAWTASADGRYDFEEGRTAEAGVGFEFRNECLSVDLSLSRRFTSSTSVSPSTDFGLSVDLIGFGSGAAPGPSRVCRR
ncbi:LPS assembly protein LptD [Cereibacter sphaeroides]|uniref:LPS-assembly protein LptD n=1 Tax=Cereibacter sphaeroides TaxID=1063 RepID=UPI001F2224B1|nr:LPS assembly protein LptD [Cereibacter sphaeroides]MCE6962062.1 LPS assembly protein LptD [Cereibacter sphaeroides]MCE6970837.1 LPS assembly protein LptD [Cereibacter sphaeroides]MCE6975567.1 LPS assembly protein LptD [Cereibacter sphaeroides]